MKLLLIKQFLSVHATLVASVSVVYKAVVSACVNEQPDVTVVGRRANTVDAVLQKVLNELIKCYQQQQLCV